jgi:KaiC domain protein
MMVSTGIKGLDEMLGGGLPEGHAIAVLGNCGTGKTTFGLQFVWEGLLDGERCVFISLEEEPESIIRNADNYGWEIAPYIKSKHLQLVKLNPADAKSTVTKIKSELPKFLKEHKVKRVVLDSISLFNMMFKDEVERRIHLFDLHQMIKKSGATTFLTAEVKDENPTSSRDGLVEYVSDGVIILGFNEKKESSEITLNLRILKMRRLRHSRKIKPYSITEKGIVVHSELEVF